MNNESMVNDLSDVARPTTSLERVRQPGAARKSERAARHQPAATHPATVIMFVFVAGILWMGWRVRDEYYYVAEEGLGYALGILGSLCMLLLLVYPLRKTLRCMRSWGPVKYYFRLHMTLGIVGPMLILFHANFHLHAINSNVALFSMLLVAASGLVGRFIYTRIHHGLYGERLTLKALRQAFGISKEDVEHEFFITPAVKERLRRFEIAEQRSSQRWVVGFLKLVTRRLSARWLLWETLHTLKKGLKARARAEQWERGVLRLRLAHDRQVIETYLAAVCRVAEFGFYERIFSVWHVLHIPLYIMLVITGTVHVVAVHMY